MSTATTGELLDLGGAAHYGIDTQARRQAVDGAQMAATYTILTTALNHHGNAHRITESADGQGLRLEKHQRNPLVLLQHGSAPLKFPQIGASLDPAGNYTVRRTRQRATGTVYFEEANPDAAFVFAMVEGGRVFQMASIGFVALKGRRLKPPLPAELPAGVADFTDYGAGFLFTETVLHEWSIVDDGADPGAFRQMADRGWSLNEYRPTDRLRHYLQEAARQAPRSWGFAGADERIWQRGEHRAAGGDGINVDQVAAAVCRELRADLEAATVAAGVSRGLDEWAWAQKVAAGVAAGLRE